MDLRTVALALGDDLFVQCQSLSPWTVNYVDLEESLAVGSIAQEVLAHGGVLYEIAGVSPEERDQRIYRRAASEWAVSSVSFFSQSHWPALVAGAYVAAAASRAIVDELRVSSDSAAQELALVHSEQVLHINHWRRWVSLLTSDSETSSEMAKAMSDVLARSGDLLPVGAGHDKAYSHWAASVSADLASWGLNLSAEVPRTERIVGGVQVARMIDDLHSARNLDGSSNYAVY